MMMPTTIDICIVTCKRPLILRGLLDSLTAQNLDGLLLRVIVIDNDLTQSARCTVDSFRRSQSSGNVLEVVYDVESDPCIAHARNRALRHAKADYVALVDDDETVSRDWLRQLLDTMHRYQADVVFGPVISVLPNGAPPWARRCFHRTRRRTGEPVHHYGAGNVLLRRPAITADRLRFDPAFGGTGGEDTDFFYRLHLAGRRMVWCDEAIAHVAVPAARLTLAWMRERGFNGGQNWARIFASRYSYPRKLLWLVLMLAQLTIGLPLALGLRWLAYPQYVALTVRLAGTAGQLAACFPGGHLEGYNPRHSR